MEGRWVGGVGRVWWQSGVDIFISSSIKHRHNPTFQHVNVAHTHEGGNITSWNGVTTSKRDERRGSKGREEAEERATLGRGEK